MDGNEAGLRDWKGTLKRKGQRHCGSRVRVLEPVKESFFVVAVFGLVDIGNIGFWALF